MLDLLRAWPTPEALRHAGRRRIGNRLKKRAPRMGERLAGEIIDALGQQTVTVVGTNAATIVLPQLARMLADIRESRDTVFTRVEAIALARRRCDTLYAMLRDGTLYEPRLNPSGLTKTIEAPPATLRQWANTAAPNSAPPNSPAPAASVETKKGGSVSRETDPPGGLSESRPSWELPA